MNSKPKDKPYTQGETRLMIHALIHTAGTTTPVNTVCAFAKTTKG